ncbi:MAG: hypothetical protein D6728_09965 [Cyanobacteria bacterium J055]|nr:MAG: hypothetical protein D6728_09965 [Cyanobacteria bacterium J055]
MGDETPAFNNDSHGLTAISPSIGDRIILQIGQFREKSGEISMIASATPYGRSDFYIQKSPCILYLCKDKQEIVFSKSIKIKATFLEGYGFRKILPDS